jgi:hypothetical protein
VPIGLQALVSFSCCQRASILLDLANVRKESAIYAVHAWGWPTDTAVLILCSTAVCVCNVKSFWPRPPNEIHKISLPEQVNDLIQRHSHTSSKNLAP